jgi:hypothetical protein
MMAQIIYLAERRNLRRPAVSRVPSRFVWPGAIVGCVLFWMIAIGVVFCSALAEINYVID